MHVAGQQRHTHHDHAVGTDLVQYADQQHGGTRGGLLGGVRQPSVQRHHGGLDDERHQQADEHDGAFALA